MTWKPSYLTREQMEERRLEGGRLLKAGKLSQAEIARHLGVSRATVSDWTKTVEAKGIRGLRKRKAAGSQSKLSKPQKEKLKRMAERRHQANKEMDLKFLNELRVIFNYSHEDYSLAEEQLKACKE